MEATAIMTEEILKRLGNEAEGWSVGDEFTFQYELEWQGKLYHSDGEAVVTLAEYVPNNDVEPIEITDLVEVEIDGEAAEEALIDAMSAAADYAYDSMRDRQMMD